MDTKIVELIQAIEKLTAVVGRLEVNMERLEATIPKPRMVKSVPLSGMQGGDKILAELLAEMPATDKLLEELLEEIPTADKLLAEMEAAERERGVIAPEELPW